MIKTFRHKGLEKLFREGKRAGVRVDHEKKLRLILARLDASLEPRDMDLPGLRLHPLKGNLRGFFAVSVNGNWRVIFRFLGPNAVDVDYNDYH